MKHRVLLDCDGVLADFHTPCLAIINRLMGTNHTLADVTEWDIFDALRVVGDDRRVVYDEMHQPGFCRSLPVYPGAKEGVDELRKIADVFIVTSPMAGPQWTHERDQWLMSHFGFTTKQIIHASAKYVCAGDVLIDDRLSNLVTWANGHPNGVPIWWKGMYDVEKDRIVSALDWNDVIHYVAHLDCNDPLPRVWHHE